MNCLAGLHLSICAWAPKKARWTRQLALRVIQAMGLSENDKVEDGGAPGGANAQDAS